MSGALIRAAVLPEKAVRDAEHIALAAIHNVPYLVTWNFASSVKSVGEFWLGKLAKDVIQGEFGDSEGSKPV